MADKMETEEVKNSGASEKVKNGGASEIKVLSGTGELELKIEDDEEVLQETEEKKDFTSEDFKLELHGMPRYFGIGSLKKTLNKTLELNVHRIKPAGAGLHYVYISFRNEEDRQKAREKLEGYEWKKSVFSVKEAEAAEDPMAKKRKKDLLDEEPFLLEDGGEGIKKSKITEEDETMTIADKIKKATTPLGDLPYQEQLLMKQKDADTVIRTLGNGLKKLNPDLIPYIKEQKGKFDGLCCELYNTRASPVTEKYRNKCEFTIGLNPETNERTVGFRLSSYKEGSIGVGPIDHLTHLPDIMKYVAEVFQQYVQLSPLEPYNPETHKGVWRQLTVRTTRKDHLMVIVVIHPQSMDLVTLLGLKEEIKNFFASGAGRALGVTSLYYQAQGQKESGVEPEYELLDGDQYIVESFNNLSFKISPDSFFQVNTEAAELLYNTITEVAQLNDSTTLLDVCCGTGTIGIGMSTTVGQVLGVEMVEEAVECAKMNALDNEVLNCQFFAGKAESILHQVMQRALFKDIVAVVDPPRAGLHNKAMSVLRRAEGIQKVVYLSCDPKAAVKNFLDLGRPYSNTFQGAPFVPVKAIPVDMFPNSPHYELVVLFERFDPDKYPQPDTRRFYSKKTMEVMKRREEQDEYEEAAYAKRRGGRSNFGSRSFGGGFEDGDGWSGPAGGGFRDEEFNQYGRRGYGGMGRFGRGGYDRDMSYRGDDNFSRSGFGGKGRSGMTRGVSGMKSLLDIEVSGYGGNSSYGGSSGYGGSSSYGGGGSSFGGGGSSFGGGGSSFGGGGSSFGSGGSSFVGGGSSFGRVSSSYGGGTSGMKSLLDINTGFGENRGFGGGSSFGGTGNKPGPGFSRNSNYSMSSGNWGSSYTYGTGGQSGQWQKF